MSRGVIAPLAMFGSACLVPDTSNLIRCSEGDCTGGAPGSGGGIAITCTDTVEAFPEIPGLSFDTSSPDDAVRRDLQVRDTRLLALAADPEKRWRPVLVDFATMSVENALEKPGVEDGNLRAIALGSDGRFYSASPAKLWKTTGADNVFGVDPQGLSGLTALFIDPSNEHILFLARESGATQTEIVRVDTELTAPPMELVATLAGQPAVPMTLVPPIASEPARIAVRMRERVTTCVFDGAACATPKVFQAPASGEPWAIGAAAWAPNETTGLLDIVIAEQLTETASIDDTSSGRLAWFLAEGDAAPVLPNVLWRARAVSVMPSVAPEIAFSAEVSTATGSIPVIARCPLRDTIAPDLTGCSCVAGPERATVIANDPKTQTFYFQSGTTLYRWPSPP